MINAINNDIHVDSYFLFHLFTTIQAFAVAWFEELGDSTLYFGLNDRETRDTWVWEAGDDPGFIWSGGFYVGGDGVPIPADAFQ